MYHCLIFPPFPSAVVSSSITFHAGSPLQTGWRALGKYFCISNPQESASFHKEPFHSGRGCFTSRETNICIIKIKGRNLLPLAELAKLGWALIPLKTGHLLPSSSTDFSSTHSAIPFCSAVSCHYQIYVAVGYVLFSKAEKTNIISHNSVGFSWSHYHN